MTSWLDLTDEQKTYVVRHDNINFAYRPEKITCPWCDEEQTYLEWEDVSYNDDDFDERECSNCDKKFTIQTRVTTEWVTQLPEEYLMEQAIKEFPKYEEGKKDDN